LLKKLRAVPFADGVWKERFSFLQDVADSDTRPPQRNRINANVVALWEKSFRIAAKPAEIQDSIFADNLDLGTRNVGLEDEATGNLNLRADSPSLRSCPSNRSRLHK
jgi:hypothetical protein